MASKKFFGCHCWSLPSHDHMIMNQHRNQLIAQLDDLCIVIWISVLIIFHNPDLRDIQYSNVQDRNQTSCFIGVFFGFLYMVASQGCTGFLGGCYIGCFVGLFYGVFYRVCIQQQANRVDQAYLPFSSLTSPSTSSPHTTSPSSTPIPTPSPNITITNSGTDIIADIIMTTKFSPP